MKLTHVLFGCLLLLNIHPVLGQDGGENRPRNKYAGKPLPEISDGKYGPSTTNEFDLWKAPAEKSAPLVIFIHGGGFRSGDKTQLDPDLLKRCLKAGISVAAINYRLSTVATFPAPMNDCARAVQYFRAHATELNIDPKKIAATGGSAGAGISLWLAFHDDMANPKSDDPVAKESTRLSCAAVIAAQTSYDPGWIKQNIGLAASEHPALLQLYGLKASEADSPKAHKLFEQASPITYLTADDPPVFLYYAEPNIPLPKDAHPGQGIHHPKFGELLKKKMDPLKVECVLKLKSDYAKGGNLNEDIVKFLQKHFAAQSAAK